MQLLGLDQLLLHRDVLLVELRLHGPEQEPHLDLEGSGMAAGSYWALKGWVAPDSVVIQGLEVSRFLALLFLHLQAWKQQQSHLPDFVLL